MKRIIPALLIILIILNTFGFNLLLDFLIVKCKSDFAVQKHHDSEKVILLKIAENDGELQRIDGNEIRYKGRMYDIISETKNNNVLYIKCINDKKEDNLFKILFKINKQDDPNDKSEAYSKTLLIKNYILNETDIIHFQKKRAGRLFIPCCNITHL